MLQDLLLNGWCSALLLNGLGSAAGARSRQDRHTSVFDGWSQHSAPPPMLPALLLNGWGTAHSVQIKKVQRPAPQSSANHHPVMLQATGMWLRQASWASRFAEGAAAEHTEQRRQAAGLLPMATLAATEIIASISFACPIVQAGLDINGGHSAEDGRLPPRRRRRLDAAGRASGSALRKGRGSSPRHSRS